MRRLFRGRPKGQKTDYSVLDLGASAVKALVVRRTEDKVHILGRGRAQHQGGIASDGTIGHLGTLQEACEQALVQAEDATEAITGHKIVPDTAMVAVPTCWLRSALGWGRVLRPHLEESIAAKECEEPIVQAGQQALQRLEGETGNGTWVLLDATVASLSIDGHRVTDPVGFRGHSLEALGLVVAVPQSMLDGLRQITDALGLDPPHAVAEPLALASTAPGDGLIVQVGARTTNLVLARYGAALAFDGIGQGGASLVEALSDACGLSRERADALLQACADGLSSEADRQRVEVALSESVTGWLSLLVERLRSWQRPVQGWPADIYVCGGGSAWIDLTRLIGSVRWPEVLPFPHMPRARLWDGSNVGQVVDHTDRKWELSELTTLSLAAWTVRDRGPSSADGVLRASLGMRGAL